MADPAARPEAAAARAERGELARYAADVLAATAPLRPSLMAGALAALGVYAFPILVVAVSFLLPGLLFTLVFPLSTLVVRLLRPDAPPRETAPPLSVALPTPSPAGTPEPNPVATVGVEGVLDGGAAGAAGSPWWPVALVAFWPLVMLGIGMVTAAVYRARRARQRDVLERHPVDFNILPEVVLFYVLTAGAALLVGLDSFVALGANAVFAWAGFVIWRWLFDRLLRRFAPAPVRVAAADLAVAEAQRRRRQRESG